MPRGIRNNNPGNIRLGEAWRGLSPVQTDGAFCQFIAPVYGIRAIVKIIQSYRRRGIVTVRAIVSTWAPPGENDTEAYVRTVAAALGEDPGGRVEPGQYPALVKAIIRHENGVQPYSDNTVQDAITLVGV